MDIFLGHNILKNISQSDFNNGILRQYVDKLKVNIICFNEGGDCMYRIQGDSWQYSVIGNAWWRYHPKPIELTIEDSLYGILAKKMISNKYPKK